MRNYQEVYTLNKHRLTKDVSKTDTHTVYTYIYHQNRRVLERRKYGNIKYQVSKT